LVLFIAIGAFFIGATVQAGSGPNPAAASSNGVTAAVRSVQPAISGLFQVHAPRVWADALDEAGLPGTNGVPDFLESWQAFRAREDSAILKNAYAFRTIDELGHEILYAGVQRASSGGPSKVVFEFNQKPGELLLGDLLINAEIDGAGNVGTARFESHSGEAKFLSLAILSGEGCNDAGTACVVANGALLEVGINLSQLLSGPGKGFNGIQVRTPEDSVVGIFSLSGDSGGCVAEESGFAKAGCTANDIQLTAIVPGSLNTKFCSNDTNRGCGTNADCLAGGLCSVSGNFCTGDPSDPGTVKFSATGRFVLTTQTRYDVGLFIDTRGDPEPAVDNKGTPDAARSGQCTKFAFSNTEGVNAEGDGDADGCGDLTQAIASAPAGRAMPFGPVTIACVDKDDDGLVDVYHCETWSQNEDEINCQSSADVKAGTTSKCNCGLLAGACIPFPNDDECKENVCVLRCSNSPTTVCTIGGTECTAPGFCQDTLITQNKTNGTECNGDPSGVCDAQDTCVDGVCTDNVAPDTQLCRGSAGVCDVAENCDGSNKDCPADDFQTGGVCRASACGDAADCCDVPESCDGTGPNCPADGFKASSVLCRASACDTSDPLCCDVPENCTGSSATCPANGFDPASEVCRPSAGVCDPAENCPGNGPACPGDELYQLDDNIICGPAQNECDAVEKCDGSGPDCPADFCAGGARPEEHFCNTNGT
jgi:hypothetical protein